MSNCFKCGKELPEGQVECEYGCDGKTPRILDEDEMSKAIQELNDLAAEAELAQVLEDGTTAFAAAARHLREMGAGSGRQIVDIEGEKYLVFVKRLK